MQSNISKKRSARSKKTTKTKKSSKRVHRLRGGTDPTTTFTTHVGNETIRSGSNNRTIKPSQKAINKAEARKSRKSRRSPLNNY